MKFILVAGGSGGHIYPCLELAKYLKNKGNEVLLIGSKNSMEESIYKESNLNYTTLDINKKKIRSFLHNKEEINSIYSKFNPDGVILFGNYISFSFALCAYTKHIPIYLHEQNVEYGRANKLIGVMAKRIYLSFPIKKNIYKNKSLLVGNPKGDIAELERVYLRKSKKNVFIVMGSLGSETINKVLIDLINICDSNINYHIVTGNKHYEEFLKKTIKKDNIFIYPYLNNLLAYTSQCDLLVSRSGATTLFEIINYSIPSILIPSPYVSNNHQYKNAKYLLDNEASYLIEEANLNAELLNNMIKNIVFNKEITSKLKENTKKLSLSNSKERIYKDILNER